MNHCLYILQSFFPVDLNDTADDDEEDDRTYNFIQSIDITPNDAKEELKKDRTVNIPSK